MISEDKPLGVKRNGKIDNMKCLLVILVIGGHILEHVNGAFGELLYKTVYSFHMPIFVFITGYLAKYKPDKILRKLIAPYVVFQVLYILFDYYVLHEAETLNIQFTKPYWLMWYLFAIIIYYMLIPLLESDITVRRIVTILVSIAIALLCGFNSSIGYFLSLSRICVFLPFFVLGFYASKIKFIERISETEIWKKVIIAIVVVASVVLGVKYIIEAPVHKIMLYGSMCYEKSHGNVTQRLILMVIAVSWLFLLLVIIPKKRMSVCEFVSKNSLWFYLLHGFVILWCTH